MKGTYVATMGAQVAKRDPALHAISEQGNSSTQAKIVGVCGGAAVVAASLASRRRRINRKRLHKKMVMHSTSTATIPTTELLHLQHHGCNLEKVGRFTSLVVHL